MRVSLVVLALIVGPFTTRAARAQGKSHVVRHDLPPSAAAPDKQCQQRDRGNPSQTGLDHRADPTTKGNKDCAPPVVYGHTEIVGTVFYDLDHDGIFGPDEVPLVGWTVQAFGPTNASAVTDSNGSYTISGLTPGDYVICVMPPAGWTETFPSAGSGTTCSNSTVGYALQAPAVVGDVQYVGVDFGFVSN